MKRLFIFILVLSLSVVAMAKDFVVVIDPGHGGKDVGAVGKNAYEKNINLAVALKLGALIEDNMEDVKVVYTRKTDVYLTLRERANIANRSNGNLFISIHTNSVALSNRNRSKIEGASTYVLGLHRTDENLNVAKRENEVILLEDDYSETYSGFDPNSSESYIIFEISQSIYMDNSIEVASAIQEEFVSVAHRADRGVRQAGFLVLAATSMPSVLVELDFISNPTQEHFLTTKAGEDKMAKAIYNSVRRYKQGIDHKIDMVAKDGVISNAEPKRNDVEVVNNIVVAAAGESVYKIQLFATNKLLREGNVEFKKLKNISYYNENGLYKYTYGEFKSKREAQELLRRDVKSKFKDAFVIEFKDGKRVF